YSHLGTDILMEGIITEETQEEHSILRSPLTYFSSRQRFSTLGGQRSENLRSRRSTANGPERSINRRGVPGRIMSRPHCERGAWARPRAVTTASRCIAPTS